MQLNLISDEVLAAPTSETETTGEQPAPATNTLPPAVAFYEAQWLPFKASYNAAVAAAKNFLDMEISVTGTESYMAAFVWEPKGTDRSDFKAVTERIIEIIVRIASRSLSPNPEAAEIEIDRELVRSFCWATVKHPEYDRDMTIVSEAFTPAHLWEMLKETYNPGAAKGILLQQTAKRLYNSLNLDRHEKMQRTTRTTVVEVYGGLRSNYRGGYEMEFSTQNRHSDIVRALMAMTELLEEGNPAAAAWRDLRAILSFVIDRNRSIEPGSAVGGDLVKLTIHKGGSKYRMANAFADALNTFIAEHR